MRFRPIYVTLPLSLVLGAFAAILYVNARPPEANGDIDFGQPKHPVTFTMEAEAAAKALKIAPAFQLKDTDGETVTIGGPGDDRPTFVYWIKDGCPCSFDAEPLFQRLYKHLDGKVRFVAVTDASLPAAKKWAASLLPKYPVIVDDKHVTMKAYDAKRSVYSVLITRDGKIDKQWPGYSKALLQDINSELSRAAGVEPKPFDPLYAPSIDTSGCEFQM